MSDRLMTRSKRQNSMLKVSVVFHPVRPHLHRLGQILVVVAMLVAFSTATHKAGADEGGNSAICREQCNYDSSSSCYWSCMSDRGLYDSAPGGTMGPMPAPPTLYGAIAVDIDTLATGYVKDVASREEAERGALENCRKAGGSAFCAARRCSSYWTIWNRSTAPPTSSRRC